MSGARKPRMDFQRYGSTYQLRLASVEDIAQLLELSESHWMANSAPTDAFACDEVFLRLLDCDQNERVRCDEVRTAAAWLLDVLADHESINDQAQTLCLDHLNLEHRDGQKIRAAAERILTNLSKADGNEISLSQVRDTQQIFAAADANGDGIIPPAAANDPEIAQFMEDIIATVGGETDAGGGTGVSEGRLNQFLAESEAYLAWYNRGQTAIEQDHAMMPFADDTPRRRSNRNSVSRRLRPCALMAFSISPGRLTLHIEAQYRTCDNRRSTPVSARRQKPLLRRNGSMHAKPLNPMARGRPINRTRRLPLLAWKSSPHILSRALAKR